MVKQAFATAGLLLSAFSVSGSDAIDDERLALPSVSCTLRFDSGIIENVPQVITTPQMMRGLTNRNDVGSGLLFTWFTDEPRVFWMKDTSVPLSVAYLDKYGAVLQIDNMLPNTKNYHWSKMPAREGLEVKQGDFTNHNIRVGSRLLSRTCKPITANEM